LKLIFKFTSKLIALLLIVSVIAKDGYAQNDTIFWFAAPDVSTSIGDSPVYLRFFTETAAADVTIEMPANGAFSPVTISIPANSLDSLNLTPFLALIESPSGNTANNNGLKISATANIRAYYELRSVSSKEVFSLKGNKGLGTDFYTPFQNNFNTGSTTPSSFSSIEIVASEDNTTVLITPRTAIIGHAVNNTFSITLNEGETYSARDINATGASSLSGSIVSANKPVSVTLFSGGLSNNGCNSIVGDQITTSQYAGKSFIIHKSSSADERVYILAVQNNTSINITNSSTTTSLINWSETKELILTDTINYISTNKPVYVFHVAGNGCNLSGAQVPNVFCAGTYTTPFTRSSSDSLGVLLYTRSGFEGMFAVNGNTTLIQASDFSPVPGTSGGFVVGIKYFSLAEVTINSFNEISNSGDVFGMAILEGQNGLGSGYAYLSEFNSYPFVAAGPDATICENTTLSLSGIVGGGTVTGYWSGTGYGSFQNGSTSLSNVYVPSPLDTIVSPISLILTSTGPCPVQRDTVVLTVTPAPIVNASADQTVCGNNGTVQLAGTIEGGAATGVWTSNGTGTFSPSDTDLDALYVMSSADTATGFVTLVLTSTNVNSCIIESDTMNVTILDAPFADAGSDSTYVCLNNPMIQLAGTISNGSGTGKWTTAGNGYFSPNNLDLNGVYNPSPTDLGNGGVWIYLTSTSNGICFASMDSLRVQFTASPLVDAGTNVISCTNDAEINLSGLVSGPTSTGIWSGGGGVYTASDTDLNASYTPSTSEVSAGNVVLTLTSTNNGTCSAENDIVQISFVSPPLANFSTGNVCFQETTIFNDFSLPGFGNITNWAWDFGNSTNSVSQNNSVDYGAAGVYNVGLIVTNTAGCTDTINQNVTVYDLPSANFDYEISCTGAQLIIDFEDLSSVNNDVINYWFYDFGGQGSQATQNPTQLFVGSGNFIVTQIVETANNCIDSIVQTIFIDPRPEAGFYYNTSNGQNIGAIFEFIDTSNFTNDQYWTFGDGNDSYIQDPTNVYFENGVYTVTQYVTGNFGCEDSASILININTVTKEINTLIPNAISPNGDGKNDSWKLEFLALLYPNATVEIYNRWGQQLYRTEGTYYPWNGTFEEDPVADGTYLYIIDLKDNVTEPFKGTILVLRNNDQ
jgi:gliding motility-associated-like protein